MNNGMFFTFFNEKIPCHIPRRTSFTLLYIVNCRRMKYPNINTAMAQITVTIHPAVVNPANISLKRVPVLEKKEPKTWICSRIEVTVISSISNISTIRSVTTVPNAFENDTRS